MNTLKNGLLALTALGIVSLTALTDVSARGISGSAAQRFYSNPPTFTDLTCLNTGWVGGPTGVAYNNCQTTITVDVALPVDNGGQYKGATFAGYGLTCRLYASSQTNSDVISSNPATIGGYTPNTASTNPIYMPGAGRLWLRCDISSQGILINVNYAQ